MTAGATDGSAQPRRRVAIVLVPGVGEEARGETTDAVLRGLERAHLGYAAAAGDVLAIRVDRGSRRRAETYEACHRRLAAPRHWSVESVNLIEMRWADVSRFPNDLLRFFAALFGLGLQTATVGMEATRAARREGARASAAGWPRVAARLRQTAPDWLQNLASGWVALVVVPLTVTAAIVATAFWLAVDETLGMNDHAAALLSLLVGILALWRLGRGIGDGGWTYGNRRLTRWLLSPWVAAFLPLAAALGLGVWQRIETG